MPKRKSFDIEIEAIKQAMKDCQNKSEYRRIQCVYLAMLHPNITAGEIAEITLLSESRVWAIHANFRKTGLVGLEDGRGGRYRENLTLAQETELLEHFEQESQNGSIVTVSKIKKAYEKKVGKEVAESTIYRILNKHGFRRIVPYRRHKKADKEEQEAFKKTLQT
jgi:transposase